MKYGLKEQLSKIVLFRTNVLVLFPSYIVWLLLKWPFIALFSKENQAFWLFLFKLGCQALIIFMQNWTENAKYAYLMHSEK